MTMQIHFTLSPRVQRLLALALAAIPLLLIGGIFASFVETQVVRHEQAALLTHKLVRERAILSLAPDWQTRLSQLRSSSKWQDIFVGRTQPQGGALAVLVGATGGRIDQQSARHMETTNAVEIDEHITFSASMEQISKVLKVLRGFRPLFVVRSISIKDTDSISRLPDAGPNMLHVELTVAEFERPL